MDVDARVDVRVLSYLIRLCATGFALCADNQIICVAVVKRYRGIESLGGFCCNDPQALNRAERLRIIAVGEGGVILKLMGKSVAVVCGDRHLRGYEQAVVEHIAVAHDISHKAAAIVSIAQQLAVEGAIFETGMLRSADETTGVNAGRCCKRCADLAVGKRGVSRSVCHDAAEVFVIFSGDGDRSCQCQVLERGIIGVAERSHPVVIC